MTNDPSLIQIRCDDKEVVVDMACGPLGDTFCFRFNCGNAHYASLQATHFNKMLYSYIESIRREEYENGYKDGHAKRGKKL